MRKPTNEDGGINMKHKRKYLVAFGAALLVILILALYPKIGEKAIEENIYDYLHKDGYRSSEISSVDARHSYINGLLGYGQWHTSIYFKDEPEVEYHCLLSNGILPKVKNITAGGFSSDLPDDYTPLHYPE